MLQFITCILIILSVRTPLFKHSHDIFLYSARALQTVFKILSPREFHLDAETSRKFAHRDFGVKEATEVMKQILSMNIYIYICLLYTSPSPRDKRQSRMPSSA